MFPIELNIATLKRGWTERKKKESNSSNDLTSGSWDIPKDFAEPNHTRAITLCQLSKDLKKVTAFGNLALKRFRDDNPYRLLEITDDKITPLKRGENPGERFEIPTYFTNEYEVLKHNIDVLDKSDFKESGWILNPENPNLEMNFATLIAFDPNSGFITAYGNSVFFNADSTENHLIIYGHDCRGINVSIIDSSPQSVKKQLPEDLTDAIELSNIRGSYAA